MKINKYIDHTLLKAEATKGKIDKLCTEAKEYDFASVCVNTCWVKECAKELANTDVNVCCVVGFPLGAMSSEAKAFETKQAVKDGATEIDMVINIGAAKDHDWQYVKDDISAVVNAASNKTVKVIIEACLLTDEEKVAACKAAMAAKADFVKTSTGFSTSGATVSDVKLMKKTVGESLKVKAAGGIHTLDECLAMINAGADRIGASAGIAIANEAKERGLD